MELTTKPRASAIPVDKESEPISLKPPEVLAQDVVSDLDRSAIQGEMMPRRAPLPTARNALTHAMRYGSLQPMSNCCSPSTRTHRNLLCHIERDTAAGDPGRTRTTHTWFFELERGALRLVS